MKVLVTNCYPRFFSFGLILLFCWFTSSALYNPTPTFACSGTCAADGDCSANACRYCDTGFGRCADCCEFVDSLNCPSACTWDNGSSECRNDVATSCGVTVPETPSNSRTYFLILILASLVAAALYGRLKIKPSK